MSKQNVDNQHPYMPQLLNKTLRN